MPSRAGETPLQADRNPADERYSTCRFVPDTAPLILPYSMVTLGPFGPCSDTSGSSALALGLGTLNHIERVPLAAEGVAPMASKSPATNGGKGFGQDGVVPLPATPALCSQRKQPLK